MPKTKKTSDMRAFFSAGGPAGGKSWKAYTEFMKACREGKRVLIVFPFGTMYSPIMMEEKLQEAKEAGNNELKKQISDALSVFLHNMANLDETKTDGDCISLINYKDQKMGERAMGMKDLEGLIRQLK